MSTRTLEDLLAGSSSSDDDDIIVVGGDAVKLNDAGRGDFEATKSKSGGEGWI